MAGHTSGTPVKLFTPTVVRKQKKKKKKKMQNNHKRKLHGKAK